MGALDLVVRAPHGALEHWELAYKLFLQCDAQPNWSSWLGPRGRDRLDTKLHKMIQHQLPMSDTPQAIPVLKKLGVERIDRRRLMMQGTLFCPWGSPPQRALQGHQDAQGVWIRPSQIAALAQAHPKARWIQCHKPFWFGAAPSTTEALSPAAFLQAAGDRDATFPQLWSHHATPDRPKEILVFIVDERWGKPTDSESIF